MTTDAGSSPITVGMPVATQDGEALGTVKEVQASFFKVDVRLKPDYWLQAEFAQVTADGQVVLAFGKEDLGDYKVKVLPARVADASLPLTADAVHPLETAPPQTGHARDETDPPTQP